MAREDECSQSPRLTKPSPSPNSNSNSAQKTPCMPRSLPSDNVCGDNFSNSPLSKNMKSAEEFISSVAAKIASQPLQYSDPDVWGVLTAISEKARKRNQVYRLKSVSSLFDFTVSIEVFMPFIE